MSKGFEDWTMDDVIKHNQKIKTASKMKNNRGGYITLPLKEEKPKKPSKYRNQKVTIDGVKYDSKKEAQRADELKRQERLGIISNLEMQKKYVLQPSFKFLGKTIREISYVADFVYVENGTTIVEDVKSPITRANPVYKIKKKMMMYVFGIEIKEV